MLTFIAIIDHIVYFVLGRGLMEKYRREGAIFYADWFIASASAYFFIWQILGFLNLFTRITASPFLHLLIGFIMLVIIDIIIFRAPRSVKLAFIDSRKLIKKINQAIIDSTRETKITRYLLVILFSGYAYFIYKGLSTPLHEYDVLSYHIPLAIDFFREHSLTPPLDRYFHFYFPANFEIWLSTWLSIGRSSSIAIAQLVCVIPLGLMSYILSRSLGASKNTGILTSLVLLGAPIIMFQAITPMNELFSLPFLVCALLYSIEYIKNEKFADAIFSGLSLGLAIGTKYTCLPLVIVIPIAILFALILKKTSGFIRKWLIFTATSYVSLFLVSFFWYMRNLVIKSNPFFPFELSIGKVVIFKGISTVFDPNFELNFVPSRLHWLVYPWIEGRYSAVQGLGYIAGAIGAIALIIIIIADLSRPSKRPIAVFLCFFIILSILFWWILTQHEPRFLIFLLPLLAFYSVTLFNLWKDKFKINFIVFLVLFALTVGKSVATLKQDIRDLAYDDRFMQFYGLPSEIDDLKSSGTTLLLSENRFGHLLVYPLTGKKLSRRVVVVGLNKIRDEKQLAELLSTNASLLPSDIDHVLYYALEDEKRIDPEKVMRLKVESINRFSDVRRDFLFAQKHKIYSYIPVSDN